MNFAKVCPQILTSQWIALNTCGIPLINSETIGRAAKELDVDSKEMDFYACATLEKFGYTDLCIKAAQNIYKRIFNDKNVLYVEAIKAFSLIPAFSGFEYDKNNMAVSFCPDEKYSDNFGTFKGFVYFDGAYGYVEQGSDYIEIILYSGEIKVRKFTSSHKPFKVLYGGRLWSCDINGKTVIMDNNLTVTKNKKLTLLIDTSK